MRRVALVLLLGAAPAAAAVYTVGGTSNVPGANGTLWQSDLWIANPNASAVDVSVALVTPADAAAPAPVALRVPAGETLVFENVLQRLFGSGGYGALRISETGGAGGRPLQVKARTYNTAPGGTFGSALPVLSEEDFLAAGEQTDAAWFSHDPTLVHGFRTNVAFFAPDPSGAEAVATAWDERNQKLGEYRFVLPAAGFAQIGGGQLVVGATPIGRVHLEVVRGRASGYASVIDNVTGDNTIYPFLRAPAGPTDAVLSGIARSPGMNATYWWSDVRLYNPGSSDVGATLHFLQAGRDNGVPAATRAVTVPARQIVEFRNVLGPALFDLPEGISGALRVVADGPLVALARTSNGDPTGAVEGSYGAQQLAVPLAAYATPDDEGLSLIGLRQDERFRTNVGITAASTGAAYSFTLLDARGAAVRTGSASLPPFGWTQPSVLDFTGAPALPADARLLVHVSTGALAGYASVVDNRSGDGVVTPAVRQRAACPDAARLAYARPTLHGDLVPGATITAQWDVLSGVPEAQSVSGDEVGGPVALPADARSYSYQVRLDGTHVFTVTGSNACGPVSASVTFNVTQRTSPRIDSFTADSLVVAPGGSTMLHFTVANTASWTLASSLGSTFSVNGGSGTGTFDVRYDRASASGPDLVTLRVSGFHGSAITKTLTIDSP